MKFIYCILIFCFTGIISACSQENPVLKGYETYIGKWKNDHSQLVIKKSGEVIYQHSEHTEYADGQTDNQNISNTEIKTMLHSIHQYNFSIEDGDQVIFFNVHQAPTKLDNGKWMMIVNGETYTRK